MKLTEEKKTMKIVRLYEGKEPIGCAEIDICNDEIWLNNFAIREDYRGKGYGQKALQMFIERYGVNTLTCKVNNIPAMHIYTKYGFVVVDEVHSFSDGKVFLMKRKIENTNQCINCYTLEVLCQGCTKIKNHKEN